MARASRPCSNTSYILTLRHRPRRLLPLPLILTLLTHLYHLISILARSLAAAVLVATVSLAVGCRKCTHLSLTNARLYRRDRRSRARE